MATGLQDRNGHRTTGQHRYRTTQLEDYKTTSRVTLQSIAQGQAAHKNK